MPKRDEIAEEKGKATPKTVKKSTLQEKVKKYLAPIGKSKGLDYNDNVQESLERVVTQGTDKTNILFVRFSDSADDDEVNNEKNVEIIKDVLFHYHTAPEKSKSGKEIMIEIVPPEDEETPHTICFYEVG